MDTELKVTEVPSRGRSAFYIRTDTRYISDLSVHDVNKCGCLWLSTTVSRRIKCLDGPRISWYSVG